MSDALDLLKSLAVSSKPISQGPTEPVELLCSGLEKKHWADIKIRERAKFHSKTVDSWNQRDVFSYISFCYREAFGKTMAQAQSKGGSVDWMVRYGLVADVATMLRHQLRATEIPRQTEKEYYDYVFKNLVPAKIASGGKFNIWWLKDEVWVAKFVQSRKRETVVQSFNNEDKLNWEKLDRAFLMGRAYFVVNYGSVIVANYLSLRKKKSLVEIELYFKEASSKYASVSKNMTNDISDAVKKYGPYPKWLPVLNVDKLTNWVSVCVCEESMLFEFMKES